jgi:hypothetical protein
MFPLVAIGGVIGAAFSIAKGASWLSDQLDPASQSGSVGGKSNAAPASDATAGAKAPSFDAALAAQVAGQTLPAAQPVSASVTLPPSGPDYDTAARIRPSVVAYSHVGEHHGPHAKPKTIDDSSQVTQA